MLTARNISKLYRIYRKPSDRLWEALFFGRRSLHEDFWALRDVSLRLEKGAALGVIGPNGSGKSTLLQLLCGIVQPTTGRIVRQGRVAALLELGAGFNPEFSGRENVFINGELMGLSRARVEKILPSIERFADIGEFIDRPVKIYSSGMYVRLAFSTAIHVEPDILIVDEALAVGDAAFASRCVRKFEQLQRGGVSVVFVSHDLGLMKQICSQAMFLLNGRVVEEGEPSAVVNRYVGTVLEKVKSFDDAGAVRQPAAARLDFSHRHGDRIAEITEVELFDAQGRPTRAFAGGDSIRIRVVVKFHGAQADPMVGILIRTRTGLDVFGTNTKAEAVSVGPRAAGDRLAVEFSLDCWLTPQEYTLTAAAQHGDGHSHDWLDDVIAFRVVGPATIAGIANLHPKVRCEAVES